MSLQGKRALVTGASRGIGAAIARAFAREGAVVAVNHRKSGEEAQAVVESIRSAGGSAFLIQGDVSDVSSVGEMFDTIRSEMGTLDVLVNNAGLASSEIWSSPLEDITVGMWNRVLSVDLLGTFLCTQRTVPLMKDHGGRIVNISSTPVLTGDVDGLVYASAKAAILTLTKSLARKLAPQIAVNCMVLGSIETGWLEWLAPDLREAYRQGIPLKRFGTPEEVARVATFFAGEASSYVTGQTLVVDGGEVMD